MRVGSSGAARAIRGATGRVTDPTGKRTVGRPKRAEPLSAFLLISTQSAGLLNRDASILAEIKVCPLLGLFHPVSRSS